MTIYGSLKVKCDRDTYIDIGAHIGLDAFVVAKAIRTGRWSVSSLLPIPRTCFAKA